MKRRWEYQVIVKVDDHYEFAGFLDMARYDGIKVTDWQNDILEPNKWLITFERPQGLPATIDRWNSFGLHPTLEERFPKR